MKRFVPDTGIPRALRSDNGTQYMNRAFGDVYYNLRIYRELMEPYTPQQKSPMQGVARDIHPEKAKASKELLLWASEFSPSRLLRRTTDEFPLKKWFIGAGRRFRRCRFPAEFHRMPDQQKREGLAYDIY